MKRAQVDASIVTVNWHGVPFELDVAAVRSGIVEHLLKEGCHLDDVAEAAHVSRMSLWRFMQGRQLLPATVHRILAATNMDPSTVLRSAHRTT